MVKRVIQCSKSSTTLPDPRRSDVSDSRVPVAFGVTSSVAGRARTPSYHVTAIHEDGTVEILQGTYKSWQSATEAAKNLVTKTGGDTQYWIADQTKAFQKRLAKEMNS